MTTEYDKRQLRRKMDYFESYRENRIELPDLIKALGGFQACLESMGNPWQKKWKELFAKLETLWVAYAGEGRMKINTREDDSFVETVEALKTLVQQEI